MKTYELKNINRTVYNRLLERSAIETGKSIEAAAPVLYEVKKNGLQGALKYAFMFDGAFERNIKVTSAEIAKAGSNLSPELKNAIKSAYKNIYKFHIAQKPKSLLVETMPGIVCRREFRAIENVGLYIPGGSAVLFSTLLMLAIPAKIAGCKRIAVCSPAKNGVIAEELLYTAKLCGISEFYKIGGAQAIALMAYGDKELPKVDKIFGPGNQYVTAAKTLVSIDRNGCAIDMPAGPSEVLVIADKYANPAFAAADMLSQAEHGTDSQALLVTDSIQFARRVEKEIVLQSRNLNREKEINASLSKSFILVVPSIEEAIEFSNDYAPEHLILNVKNASMLIGKVINAGSVFIGPYSPESAGDYASGTNHSLPTYGYAKAYSGVNVEQFMKSVSFQKISKKGLKNLSKTIITMALAEQLTAHAQAVKVRL